MSEPMPIWAIGLVVLGFPVAFVAMWSAVCWMIALFG